MAARAPSRRRALILRIGSTQPANAADCSPALLEGGKTAIRGTAIRIVIGAPRIALRFSRFFDADDCRENSSVNTKSPINGSQNHSPPENPSAHILFPAPRAMRRSGSRCISRSCQSLCASLSRFTASGAWLTDVVPVTTGTDWVHRTRLSRAGRPSIAPMLRTGTAQVCQVYRCTRSSFVPLLRVFRCRRQP
jgi:hypothetical protein